MTARGSLFRRSFADGRTRTLSFAALFFVAAMMQSLAYGSAYATRASRIAFANAFGNNAGIRIFYGTPHDLLTTGGYVSWRVGGTMALFLAVWGLLAGSRVRAEEDAGRQELVLAAPLDRGTVFGSFAGAVIAGAATIWLAGTLAFVASGLPIGPSAFLALAPTLSGVVFAGVGAVCAQLASSRRTAIGLATIVFVVAFVLRVAADTASGTGWLRWLTPMGWSEEMRPFVGARPWVALVPLVAATLLFVVASRMSSHRDVGTGMIAAHDRRAPNQSLLGSPLALALRLERGSLAAWTGGVAAMALLFGAIAHSVTSGLTSQVQSAVERLGAQTLSAQVYIALLFVIYVFVSCLFVCAQLTAARHEEAEGRLELEFAEPVSRVAWLGGRLALALAGVVGIALSAAIFSWIGARLTGTAVSLGDMFEAGLNCVPSALLFLGIGALVFALVPRATSAVTYALAGATFVWWMFGSVLNVPSWTLDLSPFRHVALIPVQSFKVVPALIMASIGLAAIGIALPVFRRRDLTGA